MPTHHAQLLITAVDQTHQALASVHGDLSRLHSEVQRGGSFPAHSKHSNSEVNGDAVIVMTLAVIKEDR